MAERETSRSTEGIDLHTILVKNSSGLPLYPALELAVTTNLIYKLVISDGHTALIPSTYKSGYPKDGRKINYIEHGKFFSETDDGKLGIGTLT